MCFFFDWFSFCLREMISCFFFSVSFAHLVCHDFLQLLAPNLTFFFMKTLPTLQWWANHLCKINSQGGLATNCNNKCCSNGPATIWNRRWWNNKWLVLQVWFVVPSGFRLASACLGTASGNEPGNFPSPCQSSRPRARRHIPPAPLPYVGPNFRRRVWRRLRTAPVCALDTGGGRSTHPGCPRSVGLGWPP